MGDCQKRKKSGTLQVWYIWVCFTFWEQYVNYQSGKKILTVNGAIYQIPICYDIYRLNAGNSCYAYYSVQTLLTSRFLRIWKWKYIIKQ